MRKYSEVLMQGVFLLSACISILAVILICFFLFSQGLPAIVEIGPGDFLLGTVWKPLEGLFGILPMIVGSIYVTAGAIVFGVPVGLLCAVFLAKFCPSGLYRILKPAVDLLAGIPSIVYGFFGLMVIVPVMQQLAGTGGKQGQQHLLQYDGGAMTVDLGTIFAGITVWRTAVYSHTLINSSPESIL